MSVGFTGLLDCCCAIALAKSPHTYLLGESVGFMGVEEGRTEGIELFVEVSNKLNSGGLRRNVGVSITVPEITEPR